MNHLLQADGGESKGGDSSTKNKNYRSLIVSGLILTQVAWTGFDLVALVLYGNVEFWPNTLLTTTFILGGVFWGFWILVSSYGINRRIVNIIFTQWLTIICGIGFIFLSALKAWASRPPQTIYLLIAATLTRYLQFFSILFSDAILILERFDKCALFFGIILYLVPEFFMTFFPEEEFTSFHIRNLSYFEMKRTLILQIITILVPSYYCLFADRFGKKLLTVKEHVSRSLLSEPFMRSSGASMTFSANTMHNVTPNISLAVDRDAIPDAWRFASVQQSEQLINASAKPKTPERANPPSPTNLKPPQRF